MRYAQLLRFITPHRNTLLLVVVLLLAGTAANLANPLFAGQLTEVLLAEPGSATLPVGVILAAWLALLVVRAALGVGSSYLVGSTGALMAAELRGRVYEHMQILPLAWHQQRKQGDVLSLLSNDAESISRFVTNTVVQLLPQLLTLAFAFAVMAWLDPLIALVAALLLPAYTIVAKLLGRRIRPLSRAWIESWSGLVALVNENLGLLPVLKAFAREPLESGRFAARNRELLDVSRKEIWLYSLLSPAVGLLAGAGALLLLWLGIRHLQSGHLQAADLVTLLLYVMLLTGPLSALAGVYGQVMHARGAAERLLSFFGERPEPLGQGGRVLQQVAGRIEFRDVSFAYPGRPPVLKRFNLTIEAGETVALTGPNGAGKSTLVHLLMRFIEPDAGCILLDGVDIAEAELGSLRRQIGLVAQNTLLLNGTVAENIAYGQPHATLEEMKKAAKAARAEEFIEHLPDGYATVIGDQGVKLSGGQRQRLSLARTLLKDPPVLVLDEATAMFDPEGEASFIEECHELLRQRTVILITHRPASLALADRVVQVVPADRKP
ncbi:MAG: ABC transporter ATP-binding protein [Lysobacterales bacterium]|nr:MAG: ABC transporter ATP-binding protein [Xanthomonadales bacterium]